MKILKYSILTIIIFSTIAHTENSHVGNATFDIRLVITETCDIKTGSVNDMDFGVVQRSGSTPTTFSSLNVMCTQGTPYSISLNSSKHLKNTENPSIIVPYTLYQDSNYKISWGATAAEMMKRTGTGAQESIGIWAKIADGKTDVPAGTYTDNVTATITY